MMPRQVVGFRNLDSLKNIIKISVFRYLLTFDTYASTYELKKSSKSKFGAEFVAIITDFGNAKESFSGPCYDITFF